MSLVGNYPEIKKKGGNIIDIAIFNREEGWVKNHIILTKRKENLTDTEIYEKIYGVKEIKMDNIDDTITWSETEGLFKKLDTGKVKIANFYPKVICIQDTSEGKEAIFELSFTSGLVSKVKVRISSLNRVDWFQLDNRCIVEENKNAPKYVRQLARLQIANYENNVAKITQYTQLGWNTNAYGNAVYVFGNCCIGGTENEIISPLLSEYKLCYSTDNQNNIVRNFEKLYNASPSEGRIALLYFFTGLIRTLYREAGVPVDFVLYIYGEQQNRKTTLAKLTNNLYNRDTDMDFSVRTVAKTSSTTAEKLISFFKDTTLILDDVSLTGNRAYQQTQENVMEAVVRMLGNRARKSSNSGDGVKEYFPNSNVIITGEYLPKFPPSTLSRMLILNVKRPVDGKWLEELGREPLMLSTVAYMFISWIQAEYDKHVDFIRNLYQGNFEYRNEQKDVQGRIWDHGFILACTSHLLDLFLADRGFDLWKLQRTNKSESVVMELMKKQQMLMQDMELKSCQKDFCHVFAEMYADKKLKLADKREDRDYLADYYDGFMLDKHIICMKSAVLCKKMQDYYKDTSITVQEITKQFRGNRFLITDNSMHSKSTKKVNKVRYLHISKGAVKDYYKYCCQRKGKEEDNNVPLGDILSL